MQSVEGIMISNVTGMKSAGEGMTSGLVGMQSARLNSWMYVVSCSSQTAKLDGVCSQRVRA
jgi:hypothetical protein